MNLIFKKKDVVYVPTKGRGEIIAIDRSNHPYCVKFDDNDSGWFQEGLLSFEPWPAPVHVRPMKVGWYVGWFTFIHQPVLYHYDGEFYRSSMLGINGKIVLENQTEVKYLGEELKHD